MFTDKELVKIVPKSNEWDPSIKEVSFIELNNGDIIGINILTVGDLSPRITQVYDFILIERGDVLSIDKSLLEVISNRGLHIEN
jgi:hypothetical protein